MPAPIPSLKLALQALPSKDVDAAVRPFLQALLDGVQALATKLDADATVTDTNYRAVLDAIVID